MGIYRVGGAVRDMLRGYPPKDHDYVVVGWTVEEFLAAFPEAKAVGKSFPVFQVMERGVAHEYAFARREHKVAPGHQGFEVEADPSVTLVEDLCRRDLTVNAIALPLRYRNNESLESQVIDPFGGVSDLRLGVLRHVSDHFVEDPLRVYRLARFAATLDMVIAPETYKLARSIPVDEVLALSGERVGEETRKAIRCPRPSRYFEELQRLDKLGHWMPALAQLVGVPAGPPSYHDETDAFVHTMMVLRAAADVEELDDAGRELLRWAALTHDLGKGATPFDELPRHLGHEDRGVPLVEGFFEMLRLPAAIRDACVMGCSEHLRAHRFLDMRRGKMVDLIKRADRTKLKAEGLAYLAMCDAVGRISEGVRDLSGPNAILVAAAAARAESGQPIPEVLIGANIGLYVRAQKGRAIMRALREEGCV